MKSRARFLFRVPMLMVALLATIGFYCWWQSRVEARIDLSRKLIGRWLDEGRADKLRAGAPPQVSSEVKRVEGRAGQALLFNGVAGKVSVSDGPELAFGAGRDFSVMAWIQPMRTDTSFGVMSVVEKRKV